MYLPTIFYRVRMFIGIDIMQRQVTVQYGTVLIEKLSKIFPAF